MFIFYSFFYRQKQQNAIRKILNFGVNISCFKHQKIGQGNCGGQS